MKKYLQISSKGISFVLFILLWSVVAKIVDNNFVFPSLLNVINSLKDIVSDDSFFKIVWNTLFKLIVVVGVTILLSLVMGILSFKYNIFKELIAPYISIIKAIPTVALIIIILVWYDASVVPIIVGVMIIFPILYDNILNGILSIDVNLIKMSKTFDVSLRRKILELYIPSVYYHIAGGIHSLIGLAFKVIIAGEVLSQENFSIGGEILLNKVYLETSNIFAWVIVVIFLNFLIEKVIILINKRLMSWR